jgi:putative ATPase
VQGEIKKGSSESVPLHLRNPVTPLMKEMGYGKDYKYAHDFPGHVVDQQHLPDALKGKQFYTPGNLGYEKQIQARLKAWWLKKSGPGETEGPAEDSEEKES